MPLNLNWTPQLRSIQSVNSFSPARIPLAHWCIKPLDSYLILPIHELGCVFSHGYLVLDTLDVHIIMNMFIILCKNCSNINFIIFRQVLTSPFLCICLWTTSLSQQTTTILLSPITTILTCLFSRMPITSKNLLMSICQSKHTFTPIVSYNNEISTFTR